MGATLGIPAPEVILSESVLTFQTGCYLFVYNLPLAPFCCEPCQKMFTARAGQPRHFEAAASQQVRPKRCPEKCGLDPQIAERFFPLIFGKCFAKNPAAGQKRTQAGVFTI
jgi:hypothetical protein